MKWEGNRWRRLYTREEGSFALLPLYVRALAAELLKFVDDEGRLFVGDREPWEVIARLAGAEAGERRMLRQHLPVLLADGFLVRDGAYIVIRNFGAAQGGPKPAGRARAEHDPSANGARPVHDPCTTDARVEHDPCTKTELSTRNNSEPSLTYARASERKDKIRGEEIPPNPPSGGAGEGPAAGREGPESPPALRLVLAPDALPPPVAQPRPRKPKPDGGTVPTSMQRYAAAYAAGVVDAAGGVFTPPTDSHAQYVFRSVLKVHALDGGGKPLTGEALDAWIRASAAEYRRARADRAQFEAGFKPSKWQEWLEGGKVGAAAPPARASPRGLRLQGGELDLERIEQTSRERAAAGDAELAAGKVF